MVNQALRQLQEALNRQADAIQREFIAVGDQLRILSRTVAETRGPELPALQAEHKARHDQQQDLAEAVNLWRDRARLALRPMPEPALRAFLRDLLAQGDEGVRSAAERVHFILDATDEQLAQLAAKPVQAKPQTPSGRLIERARTEFDLRGKDPAPRQRTAIEFANRPGLAQDDAALAELAKALDDPDPLVVETITLTVIQIHRFRAMRLADLDIGLTSTRQLVQLQHPAAIPILIEIAQTHRTGFTRTDNLVIEASNRALREAALRRLAEWNTAPALAAVQARRHDRDNYIAELASRIMVDPTQTKA